MKQTELKLYNPIVVSRGKFKHISTLGPKSEIRIELRCPTCDKIYDRMFKSMANTGNFECQHCTVVRSHKVDRPEIGTKYDRLVLIQHIKEDMSMGKFRCDCGTEKDIKYASVTRGLTKSCGCLAKEYNQTQKDNSNRKEASMARNTRLAFKWRLDVLARYEFTCQKCNVPGGKLQTHHILPFNTYVEDRFKVDNGIVLCQQCHTNYHARYREHEVNQDTLNTYLTENKSDKE